MFGTKTTKIKVKGMMCDHCVATVKKILMEFEGIKAVDVVLKGGEVTIKHKGELPLEDIKVALANAEYTFEGVIA